MEKRISLNGYSVNTRLLLPALYQEDGTILVFLHEALGSIPQWKSFPNILCEYLQLPGIVIERSGHGQSDGLQGKRDLHYLHHYAKETELVLQELFSIHQKYLLIGHSDGGSIALIMAAHRVKGVIGAVTMAAHTFVEPETIAGIHPAIQAFESGKLDGLYRYHVDKTVALFRAWSDTWLSKAFRSWDIREEIQSITVPLLVLQGANDQYGTERQVASIAAIHHGVSSKMIRNCGHHPQLEQPMEVVLAIKTWWQTHFR